jgi:putative transposase
MSIGNKEPFLDPDGQPHRKRCKRWDDEPAAHYLTFSCFGRQPFLRSQQACCWFLEALAAARQKHPFDLWAYVLMPEHVHLILWPRNGSRISPILKAMKLPVTNRVLAHIRRSCPGFLARMADRQPNGTVAYRFWLRGGGYDRNVRDTRELYEKIRYVHLNPVRRELVARPEDWAWSSARTYCTGVQEPIALNLDSLPPPPLT